MQSLRLPKACVGETGIASMIKCTLTCGVLVPLASDCIYDIVPMRIKKHIPRHWFMILTTIICMFPCVAFDIIRYYLATYLPRALVFFYSPSKALLD